MTDALLRQVLYLLEPIGFTWACLLVFSALLWWKKQRGFAALALVLALFLYAVGATSLPDVLLGNLERPFAQVQVESLPAAEAIVLLGGGAAVSRFEPAGVHLTIAADRVATALVLMQRGKAPFLVLGGVRENLDGELAEESALVKQLLVSWGVSGDAILRLPPSVDTHDEALGTKALAQGRGWKRVLLVTSASHLLRASETFRAQGLQVIPVPCNFLSTVGLRPVRFRNWVPRADGFVKVAIWLHEEIGWLWFRHRGWI